MRNLENVGVNVFRWRCGEGWAQKVRERGCERGQQWVLHLWSNCRKSWKADTKAVCEAVWGLGNKRIRNPVTYGLGVLAWGAGFWRRVRRGLPAEQAWKRKRLLCHEHFGVESSWLLLICVEFLGALGTVLCSGWDVSAQHWVPYKKFGSACEAGLKAGAVRAVALLLVLLSSLLSCHFSSTWLSGGLPELHPQGVACQGLCWMVTHQWQRRVPRKLKCLSESHWVKKNSK